MKKMKWLLTALLMFTAVSLACQLPNADLLPISPDDPPQPDLPDFAPPEKGFTRANPLPVGETIEIDNWVVEVLEFARGQDAWEQMKDISYRNEPPGIGEEYVVVQMRVTHTNEAAEEESIGIALTGNQGLTYYSFSSGLTPPSPYLVSNLAGGDSSEGWYAYVVAEGETDLMLIVDDYSAYDDPVTYAALEEGASLLVPTELTAVQPTNRGKDSREPAPFGSTVINEDWELTVTDVVIGDEAWEMLLDANQFNDPPDKATDYILAKINARYIGQGDEAKDIHGFHFDLLNGDGELYETPSLVEPMPDLNFDMYPGAEVEGWLAFAGLKDDTGFMLRFNTTYQDDSPEIRYLSLDASGR